MLYRVVWEENNATWEDEDALKHATNKIDEYRVHMRLSRLKVQAKRREKKEEERRKAEAAAARDDSDCANLYTRYSGQGHYKKIIKDMLRCKSLKNRITRMMTQNWDNYELVFSALRSNNVPDVNFTCLFLDMTRRCKRDMAILLASRVPDLTVLDLWGENALTLAARHGDISFAYSLLQHGIPLNLCNSLGQTAYDVACLYKNVEFQAFCITFAEIQKVPLK
ncbi:Ankyrin repeat domain-containing protein 62 [Portunus trituberculatus]|uniref:Ankyrin repeat domain-containing protein 62 n=1 Tax=Portunus trituberculatus TaxID=210409 RepID=A0A5B7D8F7_PORTR|nr:Ankyrin repeat domain-containing protein 62 [Portunus trituberculatus]